MSNKHKLSYADKMRIAGKEAKITLMSLFLILAFWSLAGFGLAGLDVKLFSTPLWVIGGCIGTWLFTCLIAVILVRHVFSNFSLDDTDSE